MKTSRNAVAAACVALALLAPACTTRNVKEFEAPDVDGPPEVQAEVVQEHARSFDKGEFKLRPAGSEAEQGAAAYILGVLQQNGYFVRLESVPVADLFRSTNVIAQPASGDNPSVMLVLPYSNSEEVPSNGVALGLFLELARAANVVDPRHSVQFVALGAEYSEEEGGFLGSRRLAQLLREEEKDPFIIQLVDVVEEGGFFATGDRVEEVSAIADRLGAGPGSSADAVPVEPDVFKLAGFQRLVVSGGVEAVGSVLLEFLTAEAP